MNRPSVKPLNRAQSVDSKSKHQLESPHSNQDGVLDISEPFSSHLPQVGVLLIKATSLPKKECFVKIHMGTLPTKPAKSKVFKSLDPVINEDHILVVERGENPWRFFVKLCYRAVGKTQTLAECTFDLPVSFSAAGDKVTETLKFKPRGELTVTFTSLNGTQFPLMSFQNQNSFFHPPNSLLAEHGCHVEVTIHQAVGLLADTRINSYVSCGLQSFVRKPDKVRATKVDTFKTKSANGFNPFWGETSVFTIATTQDLLQLTVIATKQSKNKTGTIARSNTIEDLVTLSFNDFKELCAQNGGISNRWLQLPNLGGVLGITLKILSPKGSINELPATPDQLPTVAASTTSPLADLSFSTIKTSLKKETAHEPAHISTPARAQTQMKDEIQSLLDDNWGITLQQDTNQELVELEENYMTSIQQIKSEYTSHVNQLNDELQQKMKDLEGQLKKEIDQIKAEYRVKQEEEASLFEQKSKAKQQQVEIQLANLADQYQHQQHQVRLEIEKHQTEVETRAERTAQLEFAEMREQLQSFVLELANIKDEHLPDSKPVAFQNLFQERIPTQQASPPPSSVPQQHSSHQPSPPPSSPSHPSQESSNEEELNQAPQRGKLLLRAASGPLNPNSPSAQAQRRGLNNPNNPASAAAGARSHPPAPRGTANTPTTLTKRPSDKRGTVDDEPSPRVSSPREDSTGGSSGLGNSRAPLTRQPAKNAASSRQSEHQDQEGSFLKRPSARPMWPVKPADSPSHDYHDSSEGGHEASNSPDMAMTRPSYRPVAKREQNVANQSSSPTPGPGGQPAWLARMSSRNPADHGDEHAAADPPTRRKPGDATSPASPQRTTANPPRGWPPREKSETDADSPTSPLSQSREKQEPTREPPARTESQSAVTAASSSPAAAAPQNPTPATTPAAPAATSGAVICVVCKQGVPQPINLGGRNFCARCAEIIRARANAKGITLKEES